MTRPNRTQRGEASTSRRGRTTVLLASAVALGLLTVALVALLPPYLEGRAAPADAAEVRVELVDARQGINVVPQSIDIGDVFMDVSEVPIEFSVVNTGDRVAVITYIETSCDCTTATVVVDGKEGPRFGMQHGTPPGTFDWRVVLAPGDDVTLMVYYNPQAHGVLTEAQAPAIHGPTTRLVRLHADDSTETYVVDVRIDLDQRH